MYMSLLLVAYYCYRYCYEAAIIVIQFIFSNLRRLSTRRRPPSGEVMCTPSRDIPEGAPIMLLWIIINYSLLRLLLLLCLLLLLLLWSLYTIYVYMFIWCLYNSCVHAKQGHPRRSRLEEPRASRQWTPLYIYIYIYTYIHTHITHNVYTQYYDISNVHAEPGHPRGSPSYILMNHYCSLLRLLLLSLLLLHTICVYLITWYVFNTIIVCTPSRDIPGGAPIIWY